MAVTAVSFRPAGSCCPRQCASWRRLLAPMLCPGFGCGLNLGGGAREMAAACERRFIGGRGNGLAALGNTRCPGGGRCSVCAGRMVVGAPWYERLSCGGGAGRLSLGIFTVRLGGGSGGEGLLGGVGQRVLCLLRLCLWRCRVGCGLGVPAGALANGSRHAAAGTGQQAQQGMPSHCTEGGWAGRVAEERAEAGAAGACMEREGHGLQDAAGRRKNAWQGCSVVVCPLIFPSRAKAGQASRGRRWLCGQGAHLGDGGGGGDRG